MASSLPLPVRVAVGAVVAGLERLRELPTELPGLSVSLAGKAVRLSMRVQQEVTALAGKGDELLDSWFSRPEERPSWARFDDEEGSDSPAASGDGATAGGGASAAADEVVAADTTVDAATTAADDVVAAAAGAGRAADAVQSVATAADAAFDPTPDMPGYDDLRVAQVQARLRQMDAAAVRRLLAHEQAGRARAPFITALTNRLTRLESSAQQSHTP